MSEKEIHHKEKIAFLLISAMFVLIILGSNLTGYATYSETVRPLCSINEDCSTNETCCLFYEKEAGVCHSAEYCQQIEELTQEEYFKSSSNKEIEIEYPLKNKNINILLSVFTLAIILILIFLITKKEKKANPKKKKKK